jgi:hypothetical protein
MRSPEVRFERASQIDAAGLGDGQIRVSTPAFSACVAENAHLLRARWGT